MKKLLTFILALIAIICLSTCFVACDKPDDNGGVTPPETVSISLNRVSANLVIGEKASLTATVKNGANSYEVAWGSSDANVVSVEDGKLEAISTGVAEITATYTDGTNTCSAKSTITVGTGGMLPVLCFDNTANEGSSYLLINGSNFSIKPYVLFNGMKFYDVEVQYTTSGENVVEFNGNEIQAVGVGEVKVNAVATWRGFTFDNKNLMSSSFDVKVQNDYLMLMNGGLTKDVLLYTKAESDGISYPTSMDFDLEMYVNGVASSNPIQVSIANNDIVTYSDGVLSKKAFGETTITLTWLSDDNVPFEKVITVNVERPVRTLSDKIDNFSSMDGMVLYAENEGDPHVETSLFDLIFDGETPQILDIFQTYHDNGAEIATTEEITFTQTGEINDVYNLASGKQEVVLTIGTNEELINVTVLSATKVFAQDNFDEFKPMFNSSKKNTNKGYFILCENVSGITTGTRTQNKEDILAGVFDGQGYTMSNVTIIGLAGLFGTFSDTQVPGVRPGIKNLAIVDVTIDADPITSADEGKVNIKKWATNARACVLAYSCKMSSKSKAVLLENIYIQMNPLDSYTDKVFPICYEMTYMEMKNVLIDYQVTDNFNIPVRGNNTDELAYGSLIANKNLADSKYGTFTDVYVISPIVLSSNEVGTSNSYCDAENVGTSGATVIKGVRRYDDANAMKSDSTNNYANFSSQYWKVVGGMLYWHSVQA